MITSHFARHPQVDPTRNCLMRSCHCCVHTAVQTAVQTAVHCYDKQTAAGHLLLQHDPRSCASLTWPHWRRLSIALASTKQCCEKLLVETRCELTRHWATHRHVIECDRDRVPCGFWPQQRMHRLHVSRPLVVLPKCLEEFGTFILEHVLQHTQMKTNDRSQNKADSTETAQQFRLP